MPCLDLKYKTVHTKWEGEINVSRDENHGSGNSGFSSENGKYLTFSLENEEYGIGILKVKEII